MQKPSTLLALPVISINNFRWISAASRGLENFGSRRLMDCKSLNDLHFGDPTRSTRRSVRKYSHRISAFA